MYLLQGLITQTGVDDTRAWNLRLYKHMASGYEISLTRDYPQQGKRLINSAEY